MENNNCIKARYYKGPSFPNDNKNLLWIENDIMRGFIVDVHTQCVIGTAIDHNSVCIPPTTNELEIFDENKYRFVNLTKEGYEELLDINFNDLWDENLCQMYNIKQDDFYKFCQNTVEAGKYLCNDCSRSNDNLVTKFSNGLTLEEHRQNVKEKRIKIAMSQLGISEEV